MFVDERPMYAQGIRLVELAYISEDKPWWQGHALGSWGDGQMLVLTAQ